MLRSTPRLRRGALLIRGPCGAAGSRLCGAPLKKRCTASGTRESFLRNEVKFLAAGRRSVSKGLLLLVGGLPDIVADDVEQSPHLDLWHPDLARHGDRKRAVGEIAVERGLAVLGG